jgi:uncharacterized membrane protein
VSLAPTAVFTRWSRRAAEDPAGGRSQDMRRYLMWELHVAVIILLAVALSLFR